MVIIGITGTLGAGKGTVVERLKKKGFLHFSIRAFLNEELERRGLPKDRDNQVALANEWREQNSPGYLAEQLYKQAIESGKDCVLESIRTLGEVAYLRSCWGQFFLLAIDADRQLRYQWISRRASETDMVSFEKFVEDEEAEMRSTDPNKQNLSQCIAVADYELINNGTVEELERKVDLILSGILKMVSFI